MRTLKSKLLFGKLTFIFLLSLSFLFQSCLEDQCDETRTLVQINPVFKSGEEIRISPKFYEERTLKDFGKIYLYKHYLFINERESGVHIFDNTDQSNPTYIGFIEIPGNVDMAIQNDILYADNYMDLLSINIQNIRNPILTCRDESVFNQYYYDESRRQFLVGYEETENILEVDCTNPDFNNRFIFTEDGIFTDVATDSTPGGGGAEGDNFTGTGGSLARFSLINDYLYTIDNFQMYVFNLFTPEKPQLMNEIQIGFNIETLFAYKDYMFIGSSDGLFIYDLEDPSRPQFRSNFTHARACDPVVVQDDIAYVTLRDGSRCESFTNQLEVLDVQNVDNPRLLYTYSMDNPHGLAVRGNRLFICEGDFGLKSYDISDLSTINNNRLDHIKNHTSHDVISTSNDHILVVGPNKLIQYKVDSNGKLIELSVIPSNQ